MAISLLRSSAGLTATLTCDRCRTPILSASGAIDGKDTLALAGPAVREHGARLFRVSSSTIEIHCAACVEGAGRDSRPAAGQAALFGEVA